MALENNTAELNNSTVGSDGQSKPGSDNVEKKQKQLSETDDPRWLDRRISRAKRKGVEDFVGSLKNEIGFDGDPQEFGTWLVEKIKSPKKTDDKAIEAERYRRQAEELGQKLANLEQRDRETRIEKTVYEVASELSVNPSDVFELTKKNFDYDDEGKIRVKVDGVFDYRKTPREFIAEFLDQKPYLKKSLVSTGGTGSQISTNAVPGDKPKTLTRADMEARFNAKLQGR